MKRNLDLDPVIWTMVDLEAQLLETSGSCIVRTAVLSWLARAHQTRLPALFVNEGIIEKYQNLLQKMHMRCTEKEDLETLASFLELDGKKLMYRIMDHCITLLEEQRKSLLLHAKRQRKHKVNPS